MFSTLYKNVGQDKQSGKPADAANLATAVGQR